MEEEALAVVYTPTRRPRPRRGRGFSSGEIERAGLTIHEARGLGISVDKRRRTSHPHNVQTLKKLYGAAVPLTEIKGIGEVTERKLLDAGILDAHDLASADPNVLSKKVSRSIKTLRRWQKEAGRLLKE